MPMNIVNQPPAHTHSKGQTNRSLFWIFFSKCISMDLFCCCFCLFNWMSFEWDRKLYLQWRGIWPRGKQWQRATTDWSRKRLSVPWPTSFHRLMVSACMACDDDGDRSMNLDKKQFCELISLWWDVVGAIEIQIKSKISKILRILLCLEFYGCRGWIVRWECRCSLSSLIECSLHRRTDLTLPRWTVKTTP